MEENMVGGRKRLPMKKKMPPRPPEHIKEIAKKSSFKVKCAVHNTTRGCLYCGEGYSAGQYIGMGAGIRTAHLDCLLMAYEERRLLLGWSGAKYRKAEHLARSLSASDSWDKAKAARVPVRPMEAFLDPRDERECFGQHSMVSSRCDACLEALQCQPYTKVMPKKAEAAVMHCFGRHDSLSPDCNYCGYRVACKEKLVSAAVVKEAELERTSHEAQVQRQWLRMREFHDEDLKRRLEHGYTAVIREAAAHEIKLRARGDMKEVAFAQIYGGQPSKIQGVAADCAGIDVETHPMDSWERPHKDDNGCMCGGRPGHEDVCEELDCSYRGHTKKEDGMEFGDELLEDYADKDAVITQEMVRANQETEEHMPVVDPAFLSSCDCFKPQRIAVLVMTPSARPSENCVRELDRQLKYDKFIQEQWEKLAAEKLKEWKVENSLNLPRCPEHEGRWGLEGNQEVQVSLEAKIMRVNHRSGQPLRWMRYLWLVCPGVPKGADRRSKPVL